MARCVNCGAYVSNGDGVYFARSGLQFCSESCANAYREQRNANQARLDKMESQQRATANLQAEINALRNDQARRDREEEERRQKEKEEQERKEQEQREREEAEKERLEHLGKCAWCGKQNEQVYMNQLLFPTRKFCSKKCVFDCKTAENPAEPAPDTPYITAQGTGNIYTSFPDAFDYTKEGDTLVLTKGTFKLEDGYYTIDKPLTLKATNTNPDAPLSEKSVIQSEAPIAIEVYDAPQNVTVDGIAFCGSENSSSEGAIYIEDCAENVTGSAKGVVIKNCTFTNFGFSCIGGDEDAMNGVTMENCRFKDSQNYAVENGYNPLRNITLKDCVFENVPAVFSHSYVDCKIENCKFINSNMVGVYYNIPEDNAQCYNERTKQTYNLLQKAIDEAQSGDTITLAPGKHRGSFFLSGKTNLTIKAAVVNTNAPESQKSIITLEENEMCEGMYIHLLGHTSSISFEGLTFDKEFGRAFLCDNGSVSNITFKSCEFQSNNKPFNNDFSFFDCVFTNCHRVFIDYKVKNTGCRFENCDLVYGDYAFYVPIPENCMTADGKAAISFGIGIGDTYSKIITIGGDGLDRVTFANSVDNQKEFDLHLYAALSNEETNIANCIDLGIYNLKGLKQMLKGENKIYIDLTVEDNHWLSVWCTVDETDRYVVDNPISLLPKCLSAPTEGEIKNRFAQVRAAIVRKLDNSTIDGWTGAAFDSYLNWALETKQDVDFQSGYLVGGKYAYFYVEEDCLSADGKTALSFGSTAMQNEVLSLDQCLKVNSDSKQYPGAVWGDTPAFQIYKAQSDIPDGQFSVWLNSDCSPENLQWAKTITILGACVCAPSDNASNLYLHIEIINTHWIKVWFADFRTDSTVYDITEFEVEQKRKPKKSAKAAKAEKAKPAVCKNCGAPLKEGKKFCTKCGTKI